MMKKKLLIFLWFSLNLVSVSQAQPVSWENDSFLAGSYGGLTAASGDLINHSLFTDYCFDWMWLNHQCILKPVLEGDKETIQQIRDISTRGRIILRLWPWGSRSIDGSKMYTPADSNLDGKDWLHLADTPKLLQASLDSMNIQIDAILNACGPDSLYGVTISEEEPDVGMNYGRGVSALKSDPKATEKIIRVSNAMYEHLKKRYPNLKVGISFYPCDFEGNENIFSKSEMDQFNRDMVVMDCYPNNEGALKRSISTWKRYYPLTEDVYVLIWGCGSVESVVPESYTIKGYSRGGRVKDIRLARKTLQAFRDAGYRNIGWFGLGWPSPVREWVLKTVEHESTSNLATWNATERWSTLNQRSSSTCNIWCEIAERLPEGMRAEGTSNLNQASKILTETKAKGIDSKEFVKISQLLWTVRTSALDFAAIQERKLEESLYLKHVADALGEDIFWGTNMLDQQKRRLVQANASLFETLGEFFSESSESIPAINNACFKLISAINELKAAYPKNNHIEGLGDRIIESLQSGEFSRAVSFSHQLGPILSSHGINNRTTLRVVFLNPYGRKTNAHPAISISDDNEQWREVYRDMPLAYSDQTRVEVQVYLDISPNYVMIDNGDWTGWFNIERVEIVNEKGTHLPVRVESTGQAKNEKYLLNPGVDFATIPHVGGKYMQDTIVVEFQAISEKYNEDL